jgi:hypothetical protein
VILLPKPKNLYINPCILVSIVDHLGKEQWWEFLICRFIDSFCILAHALHVYYFFPNKIVVKSNAELKGAPPATTATGIPLTPGMSEILRKPQILENLLIRLLSLVSDIVTFPFGKMEVRL